jgi:hypothetical protein
VDITKQQLEELYVGRNLTVRQCADVLGLPTHGGIPWRLKKFGIPVRPGKFQVGNRKKGDRRPETHGSWKGGKIKVPCAQCGKELFRFPSCVLENAYCDQWCYGKWKSENLQGTANPNFGRTDMGGENNPNWQGGISSEPYAPIWIDKRFKAGIRERDNFTCQNPECRKNSDRLTIHHVNYDKKDCEPTNLITLCNSCNCRANYNREFWQAGYGEIIRLKYESIQSDRQIRQVTAV